MNQNYKEILNRIMEYKTEGARVLIAGVLVKMVLFPPTPPLAYWLILRMSHSPQLSGHPNLFRASGNPLPHAAYLSAHDCGHEHFTLIWR